MREIRRSHSRFVVTAMMLLAASAAGGVATVGIVFADDAAVERVAEEPLEDEDGAAAPVDPEPLERDVAADAAADAVANLGVIVEEAVEGLVGGVAAPQVGQQFLPGLNRALTIEIHYLRKICNPPEEQVAAIRKAARAGLPRLAKELNAGQNRGLQGNGKSTREKLVEIVLAAAKRFLPEEQAKRYEEELAARKAYRRRGAAEMMTILIDDRLSLSDEQYEKVPAALISKWEPRWSRNLQVFMYDGYWPVPDSGILDPILTDDQKKLWGAQRRNSAMNVWFGWEAELGLDQMGGGVELKELDDYSAAEELR